MSRKQLSVWVVSKQDLFSWTRAFQNKESLARGGVHLPRNVGRELLTWPKSFKMKFVEESEKWPDETAKLDAPEDNSDTERNIVMQALLCYFQEKIRGQRTEMLWPQMSIFRRRPAPALFPGVRFLSGPRNPTCLRAFAAEPDWASGSVLIGVDGKWSSVPETRQG